MIQRSEVEYVARLAKLKLSEEEIQSFTGQLGNILDYIHNLEKIDTSNVQAVAHVLSLHNVFREDGVEDSLDSETVLENAPERAGRYFKTPQILASDQGRS